MPDIDVDELVRLETLVWQALADGDPGADARMLSEDFIGVYPSGFSDRDEHARQLIDGPTVERFELHDARTLVVSDSAVLLAYRAVFRRPSAIRESTAESTEASMYISSLWCRRGDRWVNVFSQDTPVGD